VATPSSIRLIYRDRHELSVLPCVASWISLESLARSHSLLNSKVFELRASFEQATARVSDVHNSVAALEPSRRSE
jgi:hypothetical protein